MGLAAYKVASECFSVLMKESEAAPLDLEEPRVQRSAESRLIRVPIYGIQSNLIEFDE